MPGSDASTIEPAPLSREEQKRRTKRRIVTAAQSTFAEHGFVAASVDTITALAGVSRQTFYHHFRNKSELLEELLHEPSDFGLAALEAFGRIEEPTRADVEEYVRWQLRHFRDNRITYQIIAQAQAVDPTTYQLARRSRERYVERLAEYLERARRRAGSPVSTVDARVDAMLLQSQIEYFCHLWMVHGWDADPEEVVAALTRTWYRAIGGTPQSP